MLTDADGMKLLRKLVLATAAGVLSVGLVGPVGTVSPASAADSSWGCGGWCRTVPPAP
jgi:hypothetical protein